MTHSGSHFLSLLILHLFKPIISGIIKAPVSLLCGYHLIAVLMSSIHKLVSIVQQEEKNVYIISNIHRAEVQKRQFYKFFQYC